MGIRGKNGHWKRGAGWCGSRSSKTPGNAAAVGKNGCQARPEGDFCKAIESAAKDRTTGQGRAAVLAPRRNAIGGSR